MIDHESCTGRAPFDRFQHVALAPTLAPRRAAFQRNVAKNQRSETHELAARGRAARVQIVLSGRRVAFGGRFIPFARAAVKDAARRLGGACAGPVRPP